MTHPYDSRLIRAFGLALEMLEERRESIERLELMGIDLQKVSGFVLEAIVDGGAVASADRSFSSL